MGDRVTTRGALVVGPAALIALGAAALAAYAPLAGVAVLGAVVLALLVLTRAETVLLLLVAVQPWNDMLAYPSETISVVKILGAILVIAWALRALGPATGCAARHRSRRPLCSGC